LAAVGTSDLPTAKPSSKSMGSYIRGIDLVVDGGMTRVYAGNN
jgi:hypothetical protein